MKTTFVVFFALISLVLFSTVHGQGRHSIQLNGGIIAPMSSSRGLITTLQYNYHLNERFQIYIYTGYAAWDQFRITYHADLGPGQGQQLFTSSSAEDHNLIPLYIGSRVNFHTNSWLTSFVNFEAGYSHLNYIKYRNQINTEPETGKIVGFFHFGPGVKMSEDLFGLAIGAGISHPLNKNLNLIFSYKLNSFLNIKDNPFLSTRSTYSSFSAAFSLNI